MASKSGTSHKVVPSSLADDGVLENLIETDGVDDSNEYHEQRMLEDPNGGYVPVKIKFGFRGQGRPQAKVSPCIKFCYLHAAHGQNPFSAVGFPYYDFSTKMSFFQ